MDVQVLGRSGLTVSRLCFGSLTISPSQADLEPEAGAEVILHALEQGVSFIDTAELYDTYAPIRLAIRKCSSLPVIATKTYAYNREMAQASLEKARRALDLDTIDIFLLHEQESCLTLHGHQEAFAWLLEQKEKGFIRAVGISTHAIEPVLALSDAVSGRRHSIWQQNQLDPGPYRYADIIHPLINMRGIGILDGSADAMIEACSQAHDSGLGLYGMKVLAGGHLLAEYEQALAFALRLDCLDALAIGMQSQAEVDMNIALFSGRPVVPELVQETQKRKRKLAVESWCTGCGDCIARCGSRALRLEQNRVVVNQDACVFCGYCASVCRDFALKVY